MAGGNTASTNAKGAGGAGRRRNAGGKADGKTSGKVARQAGVEVRVAAVRLIESMLDGGGSLTRLLPPAQAALPVADRALLQSYVFGLARWSDRLSGVLARLLERPMKAKDRDITLLLQLGLFQLLHTRTATHAAVDATVAATVALDKPWARGLVNGVLRNADRRRDAIVADLDAPAECSHPVWLLDALRSDWPDHWQSITTANNERAPMVLRVNLAQTSREQYLDSLREASIGATTLDDVPAALVLDHPVNVDELPGFASGQVSVQDAAAQRAIEMLSRAVAPGSRLLDACAAPGGKTAQALEGGHFGDVVALDRDADRLARVGETLVRLQFEGKASLHIVDAAEVDVWWDGTPFDAVLLDAPCTGTGVIRRHPDIKLLRRASDIAPLVDEQRRLLDAMWLLLAPGGALLYATCSILRAEGETQIADFLARQPQAHLVDEIRLLPEGPRDGFYLALLQCPS